MAMTRLYGPYKTVEKADLEYVPVASASADIVANDILTQDANGFFAKATSGDPVRAVAHSAATSPSSDGGVEVLADTRMAGRYRYPAAAAVTQAIVGQTCDISGAQEIDVGASVDDEVVIRGVEVANQVVIVEFRPNFAGVV